MTKFKKFSALLRRKFRRSPWQQYSVITSTGPGNETEKWPKLSNSCRKIQPWPVSDAFTWYLAGRNWLRSKNHLLKPVWAGGWNKTIGWSYRSLYRRPAGSRCTCAARDDWGSSARTSEPLARLDERWLLPACNTTQFTHFVNDFCKRKIKRPKWHFQFLMPIIWRC